MQNMTYQQAETTSWRWLALLLQMPWCHRSQSIIIHNTDLISSDPDWSLRCNWSIARRRCSNYIFMIRFIVTIDMDTIGIKIHDNVIKWKHFPRYWSFVRGIHRSPVNFPHKWPVARRFDVFFDLRLNNGLSKQSRGWPLETPSRPLWHHCNVSYWRKVMAWLFVGTRWAFPWYWTPCAV